MAVHDCYGFGFSVKQVSLPASPEFMMTVGDPQPGSGGAMGGGGGGIGADIFTAGRGGGGGGGAGAGAADGPFGTGKHKRKKEKAGSVTLYFKVSLLHVTCTYYYNNNTLCIITCK